MALCIFTIHIYADLHLKYEAKPCVVALMFAPASVMTKTAASSSQKARLNLEKKKKITTTGICEPKKHEITR